MKKFAKEIKDLDEKMDIRIDAFQIGGQPEVLDDLLANLNKDKCNINNLDHCEQILDSLFNYATSENEFRSQIANSIYSSTYQSYRDVGYDELGENGYRPHNSFENIALVKMEKRRVHEENVLNRINQLIDNPYIRNINKPELYDQRLSAVDLTKKVREAVQICRSNPSACISKSREVESWPKSSYDKLVDFKDFYYYCRKFKDDGTGPIQVFLTALNTDECDTASDKALELKTLNIEKESIGNTVLLKYFPKLEYLNIRKNQISSFNHLSNMKSLKTLIADNNNVIDLSSLKNLNQLDDIRLHKNNIGSIPPFFENYDGSLFSIYLNNLGNLDPINRLNFNRIITGIDEACDFETEEAVKRGLVHPSEADFYRSIGFAYDYNSTAMINCIVASESY